MDIADVIPTFFHYQVPKTFGLRGTGIIPMEPLAEEAAGNSWKWNISLIAGWIPLIGGIVVGAYHISEGAKKNDTLLKARGIAEITCLGPLLFVLDVITTIGRSATINSSVHILKKKSYWPQKAELS